MLGKEYTTEILPIVIDHPDAEHLLSDAKRIVVSVRGRKLYEFEGNQVQVLGNTVAVRLSQGQMAGLYGTRVKIEVTLALPFGAVRKTETLVTTIGEAVRKETT